LAGQGRSGHRVGESESPFPDRGAPAQAIFLGAGALREGRKVPAAALVPVYLRKSEAEEVGSRTPKP